MDSKKQQTTRYGVIMALRPVIRQLQKSFPFVIRVGLGCLFLYSSLPKIRQPYDFLSNVYGYELVGPKLGLLIAMILPWFELLAALCLLGGAFVGGALLACASMAVIFTYALSYALYSKLTISCGCFGSGNESINYLTLLRSIGILVLSITAYICIRATKVDGWGQPAGVRYS